MATEEHNFELFFPEITKEWNYELNKDTPDMYLPFSNKVVYWTCPKCKSHYDKMINDRTGNGENCPYCAGKRVNETNCLFTTHPELAKEWDYHRNKNLTPDKVTRGSHDKVYWLCAKGHSYTAYVYRRAGINGTGCPTCYKLYGRCSPRKVKRENSLAFKKPDLAKQWHITKNDISPYEVGVSARTEYWWLCENGHEWRATPNSRRSSKCKYCKKKN
ncbi:zinc-ribbon domain-containing protein [Ureibacillus chungkukjangi]|uniref:zinc-ribbon domain-containing protein n=1 Tax=Ureibacillus chungkukjangi TaxID=1202712 RepID=UPI00203AA293